MMSFHCVRSCPVLASAHDPLHGYHQPTGALQAICHILQIYICKPWVAHFPAPVCRANVMNSHERCVNHECERMVTRKELLNLVNNYSYSCTPHELQNSSPFHPFPTNESIYLIRQGFHFLSLSLSLLASEAKPPHCDSNVLTSSSELSFESMK